MMKKVFVCSLCYKGVLGGGLHLDDSSVTFRTNKLILDKKYRNLVMPKSEIKTIKWNFILATFEMHSGETHKFLIFNKSRFQKCYNI